MSIPGIALFYGGLVRQKNVLSLIMQTLFIVGVVSIIWVVFGYSWAFGTGFAESGNPLGALIGGFDKCFLNGITVDSVESSGIPSLYLGDVPVHVRAHHAGAYSRSFCRAYKV